MMALSAIKWIESRAAMGRPLNLHAVMRERPDLLERAFAGPSPQGWRRSLIAAGVDPYNIVHAYEDHVECAVCGFSGAVLGTHIKIRHGMSGEEYAEEYGADRDLSSETFRATKFTPTPIAGIRHWDGVWSRYYVIDWIIRLREAGSDLNFAHVSHIGKCLAQQGWLLFGSWDAALIAAGSDPAKERANPICQHWTPASVIEGLREFAVVKQTNRRHQMSFALRMAVTRAFGTVESACKVAGLRFEEVNTRAIFSEKLEARLMADIRKLESLKGRERREKLREICQDADNRRLIRGYFTSLKQLAVQGGIDPRVVSTATYRDEEDVHHDLDLLEQAGQRINHTTLRRENLLLYNAISKTGWGRERLTKLSRLPRIPPCDPNSGLLRDRMILLRRKLGITMETAGELVGVSVDCWRGNECGAVTPSAPTVEKIERLLTEHQIPAGRKLTGRDGNR